MDQGFASSDARPHIVISSRLKSGGVLSSMATAVCSPETVPEEKHLKRSVTDHSKGFLMLRGSRPESACRVSRDTCQ